MAVGVMAAMAPNCKRRYKKRKATIEELCFGKPFNSFSPINVQSYRF